jgi:hypothetical protein
MKGRCIGILAALWIGLSAFAAQAVILVDFNTNAAWVTANQNGQGLTATTPKYVPFSASQLRSPTNGYTGPVYYGGATGTVSMTGWSVVNSTPDYISGGGTSTGIGSKVTSLILFTNQSATVTQVVYSFRLGGSTDSQTNFARIVIRKTDGSYYISEAKSNRGTSVLTNSNPGALTWYNYNPNSAFLTIGSQASGLTLNNVEAIGEFLENRVTATNQASANAGIHIFRAWGETVQNQTITFPNPGNQIITNSVVLTATASSGLPVTYGVVSGPASLNGSTVTFSGIGSVTLSANQAGNAGWNPAPQATVTFTVSKAAATVTLSGLSQTYDGYEHSVTASTVPAGLPVSITYDGNSRLPVASGSYAVVATVNDSIYQGSASDTLVLGLANADVRAAAMEIRDIWTNGTVRFPNVDTRVGRQSVSSFSAGVMAFELPDLKGATLSSANLKFRVNSKGSMNSNYNCNINIEAIRSGAMGSVIVSNDYRLIGQLQAGEVMIQEDVAVWTNSVPRDYQTSAAGANTLGTWLADQYDSVGIGGVVFLRLAPDRDVTNSYYYTIPSDSISLTITTAGDIAPLRGYGNSVSARIGAFDFSWTFDRDVEWGTFIDGMPWVIAPSGGLNLTAASPARLNNQAVKFYINSTTSGSTNADINITVKNPPFDHTFVTNTLRYVDNTNGIFGWDSRKSDDTACPKYNASLGWDGTTYLALSNGDSIATAKSTVKDLMPSRSSPLDAVAVLTVLTNIPPNDAFRPAVIRSGTDRTNPEILQYSDLIDLTPYLIANPVGVTTDLRGTNVSTLASEYTFNKLKACLPGPGFLNTGYSSSEGAAAHYNNYGYPVASASDNYGGTLGNYMGQLAIGSLAGWLTEDERKLCRIRYIQRAIDAYGPIKAGLCVEEGAGILPGYATLMTVAGVMLDHSGLKAINQGVNGVKPWWIFADYATTWHTDGISTNDLAAGETMSDRLIPIYNVSTNRSNLNKTNAQPVAAATLTTMTIKTNFWWDGSRPINNIINLKFKIVSGAGAGPTIYVITNTITAGVTDVEKFRTTGTATATLYVDGGNAFGYYYGGKVGIKPAFQNGTPDANSVLAFSIMTSDADNPASDDACWYWAVDGVVPSTAGTSYLMRKQSVCVSPTMEYSSIHTGGNIGNLIALYALGQQDLYKGGLDKYMINAGERPGYGELLFQGTYLAALGTGTTGNTLGALWKQEVLSAVGSTFQYTNGTGGALAVPQTDAKMWYEP